MKWLFKWTFRLILLALVLGALSLGLRNQILRPLLESRITQWTGLETLIGRVHLDLTQPRLVLHDLRIKNPPGVGTRAFLEIPAAAFDYDPLRLLSRELYIREVHVRIQEIHVGRRDPGDSTQSRLQQNLTAATAPGQAPFRPLSFQGAALIHLAIGKYTYLDYYQMEKSQEVVLRITNAVSTRIHSLQDLSNALHRIATNHGVRWPPADPSPPAR